MIHRKIRRRRTMHFVHEIPLTPLIDTALTLLVIFMITTPMIHNAIRVNLPHGNVKEQGRSKEELVIYVDSKGMIFLNGSIITIDELIVQLQKITMNRTDQIVYVKADTTVSYGTVIELVDRIKTMSGVTYVALATQRA